MDWCKKISQVQENLKKNGLDGWLLFDFRGRNTLACKFLDFPKSAHLTRRFCYWIPTEGRPKKLVHAVESFVLDHLEGDKIVYASWQSFFEGVKNLLANCRNIALEYSKNGAIPYVSLVDGGTIDFLKSLNITLSSSGDILQLFTSTLTDEGIKTHLKAASFLDKTARLAFSKVEETLKMGKSLSEYDVQEFIVSEFKKNNFISDSAPIVAVNQNSANPHYAPTKDKHKPIQKNDFILIDLWAKENNAGTIYADITRVGVARNAPTAKENEVFQVVREAQKKAVQLIKERFSQGKLIQGYEVDDAAREIITKAGFAEFFIHRTGHSIHEETHGEGANMDNLETHEERHLLPRTLFSIEPGIYLPGEFGIRLEHDVLIQSDRDIFVTGGEQNQIYTMNI